MHPGPTNSLHDVAGLRAGHAQRIGDGWLTGVTVIRAAGAGAVGGVDVRGGAPGTRETDLLDPRNAVQRVHALVLAGGSAYGLAAAEGAMAVLAGEGIGFPVGPQSHQVVPIVPAAVIFDLGRGGDFGARVSVEHGRLAALDATDSGPELAQGCVGAGTGALAGGLKGGLGSASVVLGDGSTVAALVVANPIGSTVEEATGELYGARFGLPGEFADLHPTPPPAPAPAPAPAAFNTTIGVVATDRALTKAQCAKLAGVGHDGLARAIRPAHSMFDGDTLFALATGAGEPADGPAFHDLLSAGADCVSRAIVHAMLRAHSVTTPAGRWSSYSERYLSGEPQ